METIVAPSVLLPEELARPGWVQLDGTTVVGAGWGRPPTAPTTELPHGTLAPGLIDLQVNGAYGHDLADADADAWRTIAARLPETGVTAFQPTVITDEVAALADRLSRCARRRLQAAGAGARILGIHAEGPFLSPERKGAHRAELMVDPTAERVEALLAAGGDDLTSLTLAPERVGSLEAVRRLVAAGVRVWVGHSDATDEQVRAAVDVGARVITHLYNAQRPLHHREPGVVGAALSDPRLTLGLIVDLHHVVPSAVRVAFAAAADRIALVTDATSALAMPAGTYVLGGQEVTVRGTRPPVRADGTLAGSALRMDVAVANTVACGVAPHTALTAATRVPADVLGRDDLGRFVPGAAADGVWLDDDWRALATWVGGRLVHADPRVRERLAAGDG